ncbi:MAG: mRNA surveillance protein pelota [Candidatus Hodarchaeota archaeon]
MKIISRNDKDGSFQLQAESLTDLYILDNIIEIGDKVFARTRRRVKKEGSEKRTGDKGERISLFLGIQVSDHGFSEILEQPRLRIKGVIIHTPSELASLGSFHTLVIEVGIPLTIQKEEWTSYHFELLEEAKTALSRPKIGIIAVEREIASFAILNNFKIQKFGPGYIRARTPRKMVQGTKKAQDSMEGGFFQAIFDQIKKMHSENVEKIIIGGPGFTKDRLIHFVNEKKVFPVEIIPENVSSGTSSGIGEIIKRGTVEKIAQDYRFLKEANLIDEFVSRVGQDTNTVTYGMDYIEEIAPTHAIETVLILDSYLREPDVTKRKAIRGMLKQIEAGKGKVIVINQKSENGKRLKAFGGVIALLRYPIALQ